MKRVFLLLMALLFSASTASATATIQKWTAGWDNFTEPLNYTRSKISWSVNATTHRLSVGTGGDARRSIGAREC